MELKPETLFGNDYDTFEEVDTFNPQNTVGGFISRKSTEYYGALIINRVNNKSVTPQLIMATPKMHYPFVAMADGSRRYTFPSAKSIEIYEKLDGTNILCYFYNDGVNEYWTCKTRLRPFVSSGRFGDFYTMWNEVAKDYFDLIRKQMKLCNCNLSFELYGSRNPIIIRYKVPLTFALLFGVTNSGNILSPKQLGINGIPTVPIFSEINKDYVWNYESLQKELEAKLVPVEDGYSGIEGAVWYITNADGKTTQIKCKPDTIELIAFSNGGLSKNAIITTCWNSLENTDTLTVDYIKQLLLEEFKEYQIEANIKMIQDGIDFVMKESLFREQVLAEYRNTGKNILLQKAEVMRELSSKFPKENMKKVYSLISQYS